MKTLRQHFRYLPAIFQLLGALALTAIAAQAQISTEAAVSKVEQGIERVEFEFERAPLLEAMATGCAIVASDTAPVGDHQTDQRKDDELQPAAGRTDQ